MTKATFRKILVLIAFAVVLYVCLQTPVILVDAIRAVGELISPFLIGGCIAFILNVPMRFVEGRLSLVRNQRFQDRKRAPSIVLTLMLVLGVFAIVLLMVVPELYRSFASIASRLQTLREQIPAMLDKLAAALPLFRTEIESFKDGFETIDWKSLGEMVVRFVQEKRLLSNTLTLASSVVSSVADVIIGIVLAIYILAQKETLGRQIRRLFYSFLPETGVDRFLNVCSLTSESFNNFLSGQCVEAVILGLLFFFSMTILRLPYALIVSALIAVMSLIPVFGAFVGCVVGILLILMETPLKALWFLILFVIIQQLEGNLIYPRVVGNSVGLPSILVLSAVTLGASLGGVLGILFSIPLMSVVYTLLRRIVNARLERRHISDRKIS